MPLNRDVDDNDDGGNDYAGFYSANNSDSSRHPKLIVTYISWWS